MLVCVFLGYMHACTLTLHGCMQAATVNNKNQRTVHELMINSKHMTFSSSTDLTNVSSTCKK